MEQQPQSEQVRIVSSDNVEFVISTEIAFLSRTLHTFFDRECPFKETASRTVTLPIRAKALQRIIEFMEHKHKSANNLAVGEFKIHDEETMELLDVASYLRI
ncbi:elongin-C [Pancytospora philotis]|nr:elongin-C [Pancytospora philotis]